MIFLTRAEMRHGMCAVRILYRAHEWKSSGFACANCVSPRCFLYGLGARSRIVMGVESSTCGARTSRECTRNEERWNGRRIPFPWAIARPARIRLYFLFPESPECADRSPYRMGRPVFGRSCGGERKRNRSRTPRRIAAGVRRRLGSRLRASDELRPYSRTFSQPAAQRALTAKRKAPRHLVAGPLDCHRRGPME